VFLEDRFGEIPRTPGKLLLAGVFLLAQKKLSIFEPVARRFYVLHTDNIFTPAVKIYLYSRPDGPDVTSGSKPVGAARTIQNIKPAPPALIIINLYC
jgi:hypothetical protein